MTVLVIDGSGLIVERFQQILLETGNVCAVYGTVYYDVAVKYLKEKSPHIVLMDTGLPGNKWSSLLKKIKETSPDIKVLVMANQVDDYIKQECETLGADYLFDKYIDFEKIPGIIKNIASGRQN